LIGNYARIILSWRAQ